MIDQILQFLETLIVQFGPLGLFAASVIEEIIIPIPSALVTMAAGFFFLGGEKVALSSLLVLFFKVVVPIAAGIAIGSLFTYAIGFFIGRPAIDKLGRFVGLSWSDVEKVQAYMRTHTSDELALFIMRSIPLVPVAAVNIFCGLVRWPISTYLFITFSGSLIRGGILAFAGWQVGSLYQKYAFFISKAENILFIIIACFVVVWLLKRGLTQKSKMLQ